MKLEGSPTIRHCHHTTNVSLSSTSETVYDDHSFCNIRLIDALTQVPTKVTGTWKNAINQLELIIKALRDMPQTSNNASQLLYNVIPQSLWTKAFDLSKLALEEILNSSPRNIGNLLLVLKFTREILLFLLESKFSFSLPNDLAEYIIWILIEVSLFLVREYFIPVFADLAYEKQQTSVFLPTESARCDFEILVPSNILGHYAALFDIIAISCAIWCYYKISIISQLPQKKCFLLTVNNLLKTGLLPLFGAIDMAIVTLSSFQLSLSQNQLLTDNQVKELLSVFNFMFKRLDDTLLTTLSSICFNRIHQEVLRYTLDIAEFSNDSTFPLHHSVFRKPLTQKIAVYQTALFQLIDDSMFFPAIVEPDVDKKHKHEIYQLKTAFVFSAMCRLAPIFVGLYNEGRRLMREEESNSVSGSDSIRLKKRSRVQAELLVYLSFSSATFAEAFMKGERAHTDVESMPFLIPLKQISSLQAMNELFSIFRQLGLYRPKAELGPLLARSLNIQVVSVLEQLQKISTTRSLSKEQLGLHFQLNEKIHSLLWQSLREITLIDPSVLDDKHQSVLEGGAGGKLLRNDTLWTNYETDGDKFFAFFIRAMAKLANLDSFVYELGVFVEQQELRGTALDLSFLCSPAILNAFEDVAHSVSTTQIIALWETWVGLVERQTEALVLKKIQCQLSTERSRILNLSSICIMMSRFIQGIQLTESIFSQVILLMSRTRGFIESWLKVASLNYPDLSQLSGYEAFTTMEMSDICSLPSIAWISLLHSQIIVYRKLDSCSAFHALPLNSDQEHPRSSTPLRNFETVQNIRKVTSHLVTWNVWCFYRISELLHNRLTGDKFCDRQLDVNILIDSNTVQRLLSSISHFFQFKLLYPHLWQHLLIANEDIASALLGLLRKLQISKESTLTWAIKMRMEIEKCICSELKAVLWGVIGTSSGEVIDDFVEPKSKRRKITPQSNTDSLSDSFTTLASVSLNLNLLAVLSSVQFPNVSCNDTLLKMDEFSRSLESSTAKIFLDLPPFCHLQVCKELGRQIAIQIDETIVAMCGTKESSMVLNQHALQREKGFSCIFLLSGLHHQMFLDVISDRATSSSLLASLLKLIPKLTADLKLLSQVPSNKDSENNEITERFTLLCIGLNESLRVLKRVITVASLKEKTMEIIFDVLRNFSIYAISVLSQSAVSYLIGNSSSLMLLWMEMIPQTVMELLKGMIKCGIAELRNGMQPFGSNIAAHLLETIARFCLPVADIKINVKDNYSFTKVIRKSEVKVLLTPTSTIFNCIFEDTPSALVKTFALAMTSFFLDSIATSFSVTECSLSDKVSFRNARPRINVNVDWVTMKHVLRASLLVERKKSSCGITIPSILAAFFSNFNVVVLCNIAKLLLEFKSTNCEESTRLQKRRVLLEGDGSNEAFQQYLTQFLCLVFKGRLVKSKKSIHENNRAISLQSIRSLEEKLHRSSHVRLLQTAVEVLFSNLTGTKYFWEKNEFSSLVKFLYKTTCVEMSDHMKAFQIQKLDKNGKFQSNLESSLKWLSSTSLGIIDRSLHVQQSSSTSCNSIWLTICAPLPPVRLLNLVGYLHLLSRGSRGSIFANSDVLTFLDICCSLTQDRTTPIRIFRKIFLPPKEDGSFAEAPGSGVAAALANVFRTIINKGIHHLKNENWKTHDSNVLINPDSLQYLCHFLERILRWTVYFSRLVQLSSNIHEAMKRCMAIYETESRWRETFINELLLLAALGAETLKEWLSMIDTILQCKATMHYPIDASITIDLLSGYLLPIEILTRLTCFSLLSAVTLRRDLCSETSSVATSLHYFLWKRIFSIQHVLSLLLDLILNIPCSEIALLTARQLTLLWSVLFNTSGPAASVIRRGACRIVSHVMTNRPRLERTSLARRSAAVLNLFCSHQKNLNDGNNSFDKLIDTEERRWHRVITTLHSGLNPLLEGMDEKFKRHLFANMDETARKNFQEFYTDYTRFYSYRAKIHRE